MIHAHEKVKVIHRDLKPSNIMASTSNQYKIIDFGLGIYIEKQLYSRLTKTGEMAVSGHYTAPELIADPKLIDKRSDIYSLGAIWFTLLTGQPPAGSNFIQQLKNVDNIRDYTIECIYDCLKDIDNRIENCEKLLARIYNIERTTNGLF